MENRFQMAEALIRKASIIRSKIGDHGDSYEESLLSGKVTFELKIIVKEILEHLRSALDYCAREVVEKNVGATSSSVYFPIVGKNFEEKDFRSRIGRLLPGILINRPDLVSVFASFQPFSKGSNKWIADFATICNENKHEQLSVVKRTAANYKHIKQDNITYSTIEKEDGSYPFRKMPLLLIEGDYSSGDCKALYIKIEAIDEEVLGFLDTCIEEVTNIVSVLKGIV